MKNVELPLSGITVLDFTHMWSGPLLTRICASLGATVLKIEAPGRADPMRFMGVKDIPSRYPDFDYGAEPYNRNAWFNTQNIDKLGLVIDAKTPEGKNLVERLVEKSDVVVANFRAGVLERMGFGYEALTRLRRDIILIEMTGYPSDSPLADLKAYGAQFEAMSGAAWLMGDEQAPLPTGFAIGDPIGGMYGMSALMAALHRRKRTSLGCHLEVPQSVTMMALMGELYHGFSQSVPVARGLNEVEHACPHGVFRVGEDWLAIAVFNNDAWERLKRILTETGIETAPHWSRLEARRAERHAVHAAIQAWLDGQTDGVAIAQRLQSNGISSGIVANARHAATSPQLRHASFYAELQQKDAGRHEYPGLPIVFGTSPRRVAGRAAAPSFGQHTGQVLKNLLKLDDDALQRLSERNVIVDAT